METEVKLSFKNTDSLMKVASSDLFSECGISSDPKTVTLENYYPYTGVFMQGLCNNRP